jgi:hypothetical protein
MSEEIVRELSGHLIRISTPETREEMSPDDLEYVARVAIGHALNLHASLEASLARERRSREALRFYADEGNWRRVEQELEGEEMFPADPENPKTERYWGRISAVEQDSGAGARAALTDAPRAGAPEGDA